MKRFALAKLKPLKRSSDDCFGLSGVIVLDFISTGSLDSLHGYISLFTTDHLPYLGQPAIGFVFGIVRTYANPEVGGAVDFLDGDEG